MVNHILTRREEVGRGIRREKLPQAIILLGEMWHRAFVRGGRNVIDLDNIKEIVGHELFSAIKRSGIIQEFGSDKNPGYEILHPVLAEYFCANHIIERYGSDAWQALESHVYDPDWEEVIVLAVYKLVEESKDPEIILGHLNEMDKPEDYAGHFVRLFCRCASVAWDKIDDEKKARCVDYLKHGLMHVSEEAEKGIAEAGAMASDVNLLNVMLERLRSEDWEIFSNTAEVLSSQAYLLEVREALMKGIEEEYWGVAAAALSSQVHHQEVRQAILKRIQDEDEDVRSDLTEVLFSKVPPAAILQALPLIRSSPSKTIK